jgi:4-amino-4-deoxychorismate lyase
MHSWVDGQPLENLALGNRGLAYGDGLFETLLVKAGRPLLFERHLQRLEHGCARLAIACDLNPVADEISRYAKAMGAGVLKLILIRGDGPRGYAADLASAPRRILQASPIPAYPLEHARDGVRLFACQTRLAEQPLLAGLKHLNRLEQVLARAEWSGREYAEGLMQDVQGRLIEGVYSNLFLVRDGQLLTADLSRCGVAGVMRAELLDQARQAGLSIRITDLWPEDLAQADEVFVCNSVYGVWPVLSHAQRNWPAGPMTRKLQSLACALLDA